MRRTILPLIAVGLGLLVGDENHCISVNSVAGYRQNVTVQQTMQQEFNKRYGNLNPLHPAAMSISYSDVEKAISNEFYIKERISQLMQLRFDLGYSPPFFDGGNQTTTRYFSMKSAFMTGHIPKGINPSDRKDYERLGEEGKKLRDALERRVGYLSAQMAFMEGTVIKNELSTHGIDLERLAREGGQYRRSLRQCFGVR